MHYLTTLFFVLLTGLHVINAQAGEVYKPEPGSDEAKPKPKTANYDPALPNVLIIGDSISLGYTPFVQKALKGKANVFHSAGNSQGTTHGIAHIDEWLKPEGGKPWSIIHFNFGLHDLKHVDPKTKKNSNKAEDPHQADLATYTKQLTAIVDKLRATHAKLIFATTTPYPSGVKPYREPSDAVKYNEAALAVIAMQSIVVNDLYSFVLPRLGDLQLAKNVHFKPDGSKALAGEVVRHIQEQLAK